MGVFGGTAWGPKSRLGNQENPGLAKMRRAFSRKARHNARRQMPPGLHERNPKRWNTRLVGQDGHAASHCSTPAPAASPESPVEELTGRGLDRHRSAVLSGEAEGCNRRRCAHPSSKLLAVSHARCATVTL